MNARRGRDRPGGGPSSFIDAVHYIERGGPKYERDHEPPLEVWTRGVSSLENAAFEMQNTADLSKCEQPLYHLIISLDEGEKFGPGQASGVLDLHLEKLGMQNCQYAASVQNDGKGGKHHLHAIVNRVDPETHVAVPIWKDFEKLQEASREAEREYGFRQVQVERIGLSAAARDFEYYQQRPSLERRVREDIGPALRLAQPGTWDEFHHVFGEHNARYEQVQKGEKVIGARIVGDGQSSRARDLGEDFSYRRLVERLGPFEQSREPELEHTAQEAVRHAERIAKGAQYVNHPEKLTAELTKNDAVFTERKAQKLIASKVEDPTQRKEILGRVLDSSLQFQDAKGKAVYTTQQVVDAEQELQSAIRGLHDRIKRSNVTLDAPEHLTEQQRQAFEYATSDGSRIKLITAVAGMGKTTLADSLADAWRDAGYNPRAISTDHSAVKELRDRTSMPARTVASQLWQWEHGKEQLGARDVLVIDEISKLGTQQGAEILREADRAGAVVICLGDDKQFDAVSHGSTLEQIRRVEPGIDLTQTLRQSERWQKIATENMRAGNVAAALGAYQEHGVIHQRTTQDEARRAMVQDWAANERAGMVTNLETFTNEERRHVNALAREQWRAMGRLEGPDHAVETEKDGLQRFAVGDRVTIRERIDEAGLHNGSTVTLRGIEDNTFYVQREDGKTVPVDVLEHRDIMLGYCQSEFRMQSQTVHAQLQLATEHANQRSMYVGMSRHTDQYGMYYSVEKCGSFDGLVKKAERQTVKEHATDFEFVRGPKQRTQERDRDRAATLKPEDLQREADRQMIADFQKSQRKAGLEVPTAERLQTAIDKHRAEEAARQQELEIEQKQQQRRSRGMHR